MFGKVQRAPDRKFDPPLLIFLCVLDAFGIYICDLSVNTLILFKARSHPGRCIVAYKDHVSELVDISEEDRNAFFSEVARAVKAIHAVFHPSKTHLAQEEYAEIIKKIK